MTEMERAGKLLIENSIYGVFDGQKEIAELRDICGNPQNTHIPDLSRSMETEVF